MYEPNVIVFSFLTSLLSTSGIRPRAFYALSLFSSRNNPPSKTSAENARASSVSQPAAAKLNQKTSRVDTDLDADRLPVSHKYAYR